MKHSPTTLLFLFIWMVAGPSCTADLKSPEFIGVHDFKLHSLGLKKSRLKMNVQFYNPNNVPLQLTDGDLDLQLDNRKLGKALLDTVIQIPTRDSFLVPVSMDMDMKEVLPNLLSLAIKDEVELGMDGYVRVKRSGVTLKVPVHYRGKKKL